MKKIGTFLALFCLVAISVFFFTSGEENKKDSGVTILTKIYESSKIKKIRKEIARKVYSKEFNGIIEKFQLPKLEAINYLVGRDSLRESLNSKEKIGELQNINNPNIGMEEAENILKVSRELADLSNISPEMKSYLLREYRGFDFFSFAKKGDRILSYIRDKKLIESQLPPNMALLIGQLPPAQAESIMGILEGDTIPEKIEETTGDFIDLKLSSEEMERIYKLCIKLYQIGRVEPKFLVEANKLYLNLDYTRIARYGEFYIQEKKARDVLEQKIHEKEYSFENPLIITNPFGKVPDMAYIFYKGSENENVKITVAGRDGAESLSYLQSEKKFMDIYGLYMNGRANSILMEENGKKSELQITSPLLPDAMPVAVIKSRAEEADGNYYYFTYESEKNIYGIGIDSYGKIRYLFNPMGNVILKEEIPKWGLQYRGEKFILFNEEVVFIFKMTGELERSWSRFKYENEVGKLSLKKSGSYNSTTELIENNQKSITTMEFRNENYPMGQIIVTDLQDKKKVFEADIHLNRNSMKLNRISDGNILIFPEK